MKFQAYNQPVITFCKINATCTCTYSYRMFMIHVPTDYHCYGPTCMFILCVHICTFSPVESSKHRSSSLSVPILRPRASGSSLSPSTTPPSPHSPHQLNGSNGLSSSLTRRILRSRSTSLENGNELYRRVLKPLDQVYIM